ncbi:MAG: T9SS type A sorting domain-containing protein [Flavobacterium sp.]
MKKFLLFLILPFLSTAQTQIGTEINGLFAEDNFGSSIALSDNGHILAVGANLNDGNGTDSGQVRVFENISGNWSLIGDPINGSAAGDHAGLSLALSSDGNILAVGSPRHYGFSGEVRIYQNASGTWTQLGNTISGESFGDNSGWSISLSGDGNVVAIGSIGRYTNGFETGGAKVYRNISGTWTQEGNTIEGLINTKSLGRVVCLSDNGQIIAISEPYTTINGAFSGRVHVYENIDGTWTQIGADIDGTFANGIFGYSLDLSADGSILAIGAPGNAANNNNDGLVKVYKNTAGTWTLFGNVINGPTPNSSTGQSVGLSADGKTLAIGSTNFQSNFTNPGRVQIFAYQSGVWMQKGNNIEGSPGELLGRPLAISADGNVLATGAIFNSDNGTNAGQARVFDISQLLATDTFTFENISVFPNPATDYIAISTDIAFALEKLSLYDTLGQCVRTSKESTIMVSGLSQGIYFLQIVTDKGKTTKKIMVK